MGQDLTDATILVREGTDPRYLWRQYFVVTDERVAVVHMTPALWGGWKFHWTDIRGADDWGTQSREQIVAYMFHWCTDGLTRHASDLDAGFRAKLLAKAEHAITWVPLEQLHAGAM